ncbi:IQ domain-containing protein C isoform X1 [Narcine bancroftii]|uniref:IQ domain-containing protein C isoform X1 n=1 Tax=Narcine bancroftii TaxID=1343680 RepID=UPI00383231F9
MAAAAVTGKVCVLQAYVRGYLVRKKFQSLHQDYESIVKEIDGDMDMLKWDGKLFPRPKFKNQTAGMEGVNNMYKSKASEALCPEAEKSADYLLFENDEPEKESCGNGVPSSKQSTPKQLDFPNTLNTNGSLHRQESQIEGVTPVVESEEVSYSRGDERKDPDNSMTVMSMCSNTVLENTSSASITKALCKLQRKEMPTTQEELQNYRNSLAMELLWLKQAISSRKNYLTLKQQLGPPER